MSYNPLAQQAQASSMAGAALDQLPSPQSGAMQAPLPAARSVGNRYSPPQLLYLQPPATQNWQVSPTLLHQQQSSQHQYSPILQTLTTAKDGDLSTAALQQPSDHAVLTTATAAAPFTAQPAPYAAPHTPAASATTAAGHAGTTASVGTALSNGDQLSSFQNGAWPNAHPSAAQLTPPAAAVASSLEKVVLQDAGAQGPHAQLLLDQQRALAVTSAEDAEHTEDDDPWLALQWAPEGKAAVQEAAAQAAVQDAWSDARASTGPAARTQQHRKAAAAAAAATAAGSGSTKLGPGRSSKEAEAAGAAAAAAGHLTAIKDGHPSNDAAQASSVIDMALAQLRIERPDVAGHTTRELRARIKGMPMRGCACRASKRMGQRLRGCSSKRQEHGCRQLGCTQAAAGLSSCEVSGGSGGSCCCPRYSGYWRQQQRCAVKGKAGPLRRRRLGSSTCCCCCCHRWCQRCIL